MQSGSSMRTFLMIVTVFAACSLAFAGLTKPEPALKLPEPITPAEAAAQDAKWKKEHDEALARLPRFDADRLQQLLAVLRGLVYPLDYDVLVEKLGGPDSIVWCCTRNRLGHDVLKQTSTFRIAADFPEYELVVDYADSPIGQPPNMVARVRLCYTSPFGWRFEAESEQDWLRVGVPEKNPLSERPTSR